MVRRESVSPQFCLSRFSVQHHLKWTWEPRHNIIHIILYYMVKFWDVLSSLAGFAFRDGCCDRFYRLCGITSDLAQISPKTTTRYAK
jgi:hypothetical protein